MGQDVTGRDRNPAGRPENARPRDNTGKPLPRGSRPSWRERLRDLDEQGALPPQEAIDVAERLVLTDQPFYAHEVLEGPWHLADEPERAFWQGLAQFAVGLTHVQRGNPVGATSLLRSAAEKLDRYGGGHLGVDVRRIAGTARTLAERVDRDGVAALRAEDLRVPFRLP